MRTSYWNYVDALAYALALQKHRGRDRFFAEPARWHQAVWEVKNSFGARLPQVFDSIAFDERPGGPPYSPQVDHFLHTLAQARLMSEPNPAYVWKEMDGKQKAAIVRMNGARLGDKQDLLAEVGAALAEKMREKA